MFFKSYRFIGSFPSAQDCPQTGLPEFAFGGRSNVGKSSLINYLTNNRHLARTSQTPGKTQLLNYYLVDERWYLVDLPGYGFAKVSKEKRQQFQQLIRDYLIQRSTLRCLFLLIDARIPPQPIDLSFVNWLGENQIPFVLVFTKADHYPSSALKHNIEDFKNAMREHWEELPPQFITSARKKTGRDALLKFMLSAAQHKI